MNIFASLSRNIGKSIIAAAALLSVTACDTIAEGDRYFALPELENTERNVLLQDFTGQNCVNCPEAHEIMERLQEQYGSNLICVSIHAGGLSIPVENTNFGQLVGLGTAEGEIYNNAAAVNRWPMGTVDNGPAIGPDLWASAVRQQLELEIAPPASIKISAKLNGNKIEISSDILPRDNFKGKYLLWIVESNLVARQRTPQGRDNNYVHNNVFRAAVNGVWGEEITLKEGTRTTLSNSIEVRYNDKERWDTDNISVVGFIFNDNGVQQAAICNLNDNNDNNDNNEE